MEERDTSVSTPTEPEKEVETEASFKKCWEEMLKSLAEKPREFLSPDKTPFKVWSDRAEGKIYYEKPNGERHLLSKDDFIRPHTVFKETGSSKLADYNMTTHAPYILPLLEDYFTTIFVVKTTANQERAVANLLEKAARRQKFDIRSILVPGELKGYIMVECPYREIVEEAIQDIHNARSLVKSHTTMDKVEHFLTPKPLVTGVSEGAIVELIAGPFKGEKARVKRVDETHEEITIELFNAIVPIPVTVRGDHIRVLSKEEAEK